MRIAVEQPEKWPWAKNEGHLLGALDFEGKLPKKQKGDQKIVTTGGLGELLVCTFLILLKITLQQIGQPRGKMGWCLKYPQHTSSCVGSCPRTKKTKQHCSQPSRSFTGKGQNRCSVACRDKIYLSPSNLTEGSMGMLDCLKIGIGAPNIVLIASKPFQSRPRCHTQPI